MDGFPEETFGGAAPGCVRACEGAGRRLQGCRGAAPASHEMYAMQSTELIRQFLHERLGADPALVVKEAQLSELGVDSLMLAELMFEAEDRLGITIESNVAPPKTVGDMVDLIDRLQATQAPKG
jgi:acyl carrier protein